MTNNDKTLAQLVEEAGLKVFDYALPQKWVDDVYLKTGKYPYGFVWSYDTKSIWGEPYPLTDDAKALLIKYDERRVMLDAIQRLREQVRLEDA